MKTIIAITIALLCFSQQIGCQIVIRNTLNPTKIDIDTLLVRGQTFKFEFDTLYYVNHQLIKDYFYSIDTINYLRDQTIRLMEEVKRNNIDTEKVINDITSNVGKGFQMVRDSLKLNNKRLDDWKRENSKLLSINNQITLELNDAKDQIRKEKWNSTGNKMLFGVGGVIVGIGLGSLIILAAK